MGSESHIILAGCPVNAVALARAEGAPTLDGLVTVSTNVPVGDGTFLTHGCGVSAPGGWGSP
eukprot:scaffold13582_cov22-Tisochrysis_lutea.AAC.5